MRTKVLTWDDMEELLALLEEGGVIAFPTDTVYGIGVLYDHIDAVQRMKDAKERDALKPFPLMVSSYGQLEDMVCGIKEYEPLIRRFMPGALTIVVKRGEKIPAFAVNGKDTVAVRMPDDEHCLELLRKAGPMLVTSANMSGQPAAVDENGVLAQLDGRIAAVVKGHAGSGTASTIIDLTRDHPVILREGGITAEDLEPYIPKEETR